MTYKALLLSAAVLAGGFSAYAADWSAYTSLNPDPTKEVTYAARMQSISLNYSNNQTGVAAFDFVVNEGKTATLVFAATGDTLVSQPIAFAPIHSTMGFMTIAINFDAISKNGAYTLTIPAGVMTATADQDSNPEMVFNYTVNDPDLDREQLPALVLNSANPEPFSELATVGLADSGRVYTLSTNLDDKIAYVSANWYDVTGNADGEWIAGTDAQHVDAEGKPLTTPIVITRVGDTEKMYAGHNYELRVECFDSYDWNRHSLGTVSVAYAGTSTPYQYAAAQLISVSPDPATYVIESKEQGHFTLTFDGAVEINPAACSIPSGVGMSTPFDSIVPNESKTQWEFYIPEQILLNFSEIHCYAEATDAEGRRVKCSPEMSQYQRSADENTGIMVYFNSALNAKPVTVTPAPGVVTSLKTFTVACDSAYALSLSWLKYPVLMKDRNTIVYEFNGSEIQWGAKDNELIMTLPEEITAPATYILVCPSGTFSMDSSNGMEFFPSKEGTFVYTIEGEAPQGAIYDLECTLTPATGEVSSIDHIVISFAIDCDVMLYDAYLYNAAGDEIAKADVQYDENWDNLKDFHVYFSTPVTEPGEYTFVVPQGTFGDGDYSLSMGEKGHGNAEIRATFNISTSGIDALGTAARADVYNALGVCVLRNASVAELRSLPAGFYIFGNRKFMVK